MRGLETEKYLGQGAGNTYHLEAGTIRGTAFYPKGSKEAAPLPNVGFEKKSNESSFENFIAAVRSGKRADRRRARRPLLQCPLSPGHASNDWGKRLRSIPAPRPSETIPKRTKRLSETEAHLTANGLKLDGLQYRLGRKLIVDAASERIDGDTQANEILDGTYRKGFELPEHLA